MNAALIECVRGRTTFSTPCKPSPLYSKLHFWVIFSARYLSKLCYPTHLRDCPCVCNAHKKVCHASSRFCYPLLRALLIRNVGLRTTFKRLLTLVAPTFPHFLVTKFSLYVFLCFFCLFYTAYKAALKLFSTN